MKRDPARAWRKFIINDKHKPKPVFRDNTEEIERALILNGHDRNMLPERRLIDEIV